MNIRSFKMWEIILFYLLLIILLLLFCEICYRIYEFYFYKRQLKKQDTFILEPLPNDRILQYKLKPNGSYLWQKKILYKINSKGLRDYEVDFSRNNHYKIVVLGDSYTFAWGVEMQESYPKVLELILRNEGYSLRVINAGIYGYNTQQEALYLKKYILKFAPKPDLVIIGFTSGDTSVQGVMPRHPYINHCESYAHFWFIEFIKSRINRLINKNKQIITAGYAKSGDFYPIKVRLADPSVSLDMAFSESFLGWKRCKEALLEMKKLSISKGFDLYMVILPEFAKDFKNYPLLEINKKVGDYCRDIGIKTIDLFPYFEGLDNIKLQNVELGDNHPNKTGHKMMGETLVIELRKTPAIRDNLEKFHIEQKK